MTVPSIKERVLVRLWITGVVLSCGVAFTLVGILVPEPCWWAACCGWVLVALNSVLIKVIHERAVGVSRAAFVRWGVALNAIRMLTLAGIFVYMTLRFESGLSSFLVTGFSAFFIMMPFELMQLFRSQNKVVEDFERGCHTD